MASLIISQLNLPLSLKERVHVTSDPCSFETTKQCETNGSMVLYCPTVVLRKHHNPAFALACRLANHLRVPLVVLVMVLDDAHMPGNKTATAQRVDDVVAYPIVRTARRLAFVLEAIQSAAKDWEDHGAGVAVRVHAPRCRTPHHLTFLSQNLVRAVVFDEPFVHPFLSFVAVTERAARAANVPCFRVDGSTTVPPVSQLQRQAKPENDDALHYIPWKGVPTKAWQWQKITAAKRKGHVYGTVNYGHLDAPPLEQRLPVSFFLDKGKSGDAAIQSILACLPDDWREEKTPAPRKRPWTVRELVSIVDLKRWVMEEEQQWLAVDTKVLPCCQTHGSSQEGMRRWNRFLENHLLHYAKRRNDIMRPHSVSRMSCYLNLGIVSIFQVVYELWQNKPEPNGSGAQKFEDEIVKWREIGYAHTFANPEGYNRRQAVPPWARRYLQSCRECLHNPSAVAYYSVDALLAGTTNNDKWNAMQRFLVQTGELHNNARMSWGKTVVHWQKGGVDVDEMLWQLCLVNDRFALDGLSPPSYAGLLWCLGWGDKPCDGTGKISSKPASRYRRGPSDFNVAKRALLAGSFFKGPVQNEVAARMGQQQEPQELQVHLQGSPRKKQKLTPDPSRWTCTSTEGREAGISAVRRGTLDVYFQVVDNVPDE